MAVPLSGKSIERSKSFDSQYAADAEEAKTTRAKNAALRELMLKKLRLLANRSRLRLEFIEVFLQWTRLLR